MEPVGVLLDAAGRRVFFASGEEMHNGLAAIKRDASPPPGQRRDHRVRITGA
jgi:hypothetical protein